MLKNIEMSNFANAKGVVEFSRVERIYLENINEWDRVMRDFKSNEKLLANFKDKDS